jgi:hypothetical protein
MRARTIAAGLLILTFGIAAQAQEKQADKPKTVALIPFAMVKGTDGAQKATREYLNEVLTKAGFEILPEARTMAAWKSLGHTAEVDEKAKELPPMPTPKELLELGEKMGVDYVIAGRATWHTRSIWVTLGPKTKSDCTVDVAVVDVAKRELALDAKKVKMDSTAKEDALKAAGTVLLTPLFTAVSGGPKTPHETRAGVLAVAKAIGPWLPVSQASKKIK